jgi:hypothetical protein
MRFTQAGVGGKPRLLVGEKLKHVQRENVVRVRSLPRHDREQEDEYSQDRQVKPPRLERLAFRG